MTSPEVCGLTLLGPDFAKLDVMLPEPLCTPSLGLALRGEGCLPSPGLRWTPRLGKDDSFCLGARCGAAVLPKVDWHTEWRPAPNHRAHV